MGRGEGVPYSSLTLSVGTATFVESETVPYDSEVIGRTWRYTYKGGGPDRRFAVNPEIPVVRYAEIAMKSASGLNYLIQASNMDKAKSFMEAVKEYGLRLAVVGKSAATT